LAATALPSLKFILSTIPETSERISTCSLASIDPDSDNILSKASVLTTIPFTFNLLLIRTSFFVF
jgi:hypothetical protein